LRLGLAQINPTVGDLEGNSEKILDYYERARELGVELLVFPELALTGYPPEDLLLKPSFIKANLRALEELTEGLKGDRDEDQSGPVVVLGFVDRLQEIYNAAAVIQGKKLLGVYHKNLLPNYGVFDEERYFQAGGEQLLLRDDERGIAVGISICEDIWYPDGPAAREALLGDALLILNISASPYHVGKGGERERMLATRAADCLAIVAFCNLVGGQDELVFDGRSSVFDEQGRLLARAKQFEEDLLVVDLNLESVLSLRGRDPRWRKEKERLLRVSEDGLGRLKQVRVSFPGSRGRSDSKGKGRVSPPPAEPRLERPLEPVEEVYRALLLGTRDYVRKNGFSKVVVGLSGGIDSALVATIAADALGPENVTGVFMPSRYSSRESFEDARALAENLGIKFLVIEIEEVFQAYLEMLSEAFAGKEPDVTEENIQARIRGNILMALSNKFGWLVLTTGNKSELSLGYATLYGDMAGGFAVLKDVPKTLVYELARHRNGLGPEPVIPQRILEKPPSAELRPGQQDEADLPAPYAVLDPIIQAYVEEDRSFEEIVAQGAEPEVVRRVIELIDRNEYKRRQAPAGIKITPRAFGKDWRLPITNRFKEF